METLKQSGLPRPRFGGPSTGSGQAWEPLPLAIFHLLCLFELQRSRF